MPCNSDHLQSTQLEVECSRMYLLLDELDGKALAKLMPKGWIPICERVPQGFVPVVVAGAFADDCIYIGQNCGRGWMIQNGRAWAHCWTPCHWMPIPALPQKVDLTCYGIDGPFGPK